MKRFILPALVAILAPFLWSPDVEAAPTQPRFAFEFTVNTDVDAAAETILNTAASKTTENTKWSSCIEVTVCADQSNTQRVWVGLDSTNTHLAGFPVYPVPASGETCVTFNGFRNKDGKGGKTLDARKLYARAVHTNQGVVMYCEPRN